MTDIGSQLWDPSQGNNCMAAPERHYPSAVKTACSPVKKKKQQRSIISSRQARTRRWLSCIRLPTRIQHEMAVPFRSDILPPFFFPFEMPPSSSGWRRQLLNTS